jgi:hypothetical protein
MRELTGHKVNPANDQLTVLVHDEPGSGGACHDYSIDLPGEHPDCWIKFQNGPIAEAGVNGVTHEALLAILIDRMQSFQNGPYACHENAMALASLEAAQQWLLSRTKARMERGVEGTHQK